MGLILGHLKVPEFRNWFWFENWALLGCNAACSGNSLPTFRTTYHHFQRSISPRRILLGMITINCVTSQKTAAVIYFAADAWYLSRLRFLYHVTGWRQHHIPFIPLPNLHSVPCLTLLLVQRNRIPHFRHSTAAGSSDGPRHCYAMHINL